MLSPRLRPSHRAFAHITEFHPELTAFRRDLHVNPELGYEEVYTSGRVVEALKLIGVDEIHTGLGKTGVVGVIHGRSRQSGRTVGLRADMDALPLTEANAFGWRSAKQGLMHACGHDGHTAMLVGAARYLAETRNFDGTVHLIFQPGEEGYAGAKAMIDDGLFERFPCEQVFAMHNWPGLPAGKIGATLGPAMAAADRVTITITGRGGHGGRPQLSIDPVLVAGHVITSVQSIVSRNVDPIECAVISLCSLQAGDPGAMSVIPQSAKLVGTVRTFKPDVQDQIERRLTELCQGIAQGFGAQAEVVYERVYPSVINPQAPYEFAVAAAESLVGEADVIKQLPPSMGSEDFAFMQQVRPGCYLRLGQGSPNHTQGLHNPSFDFNDDVLPLGSALHAVLAERSLPLSN